MSEKARFMIGADVISGDGECGELSGLVLDSGSDTITHLVVEPRHGHAGGRMVPVELVESTTPQTVRLRCSRAQFTALEQARVMDVRTESSVDFESQAVMLGRLRFARPALNPDGVGFPGVDGEKTGLHMVRRRVTEPNISADQGEISLGHPVHASDGPIGHVRGVLADLGDHRLAGILLEEGHMWGEKEVAIPASAVRLVVDDGVYLSLTKRQVGELPPADPVRPG